MRTVLVTGGSRGIGLGIVRVLAAAGYRAVALARRDSPDLAAAAADMASGGAGEIVFRPCDLSEIAALPLVVKQLHHEFGAFYGLVNNAGLGTAGVLATLPDAQIEHLVRVNTLAPILLTKHVVRAMMVDGGARIVNVASIVAATGFAGLTAYSATKAALIGFTRALARELGPLGITVNAVAPGFVDTGFAAAVDEPERARIARRSALRRLAQPEDVAHAVRYLLADEARNVTGTVLTIDAGSTA